MTASYGFSGNSHAVALESQVPAFSTSKLYCITHGICGEQQPRSAMTNPTLPPCCALEPAVREETPLLMERLDAAQHQARLSLVWCRQMDERRSPPRGGALRRRDPGVAAGAEQPLAPASGCGSAPGLPFPEGPASSVGV